MIRVVLLILGMIIISCNNNNKSKVNNHLFPFRGLSKIEKLDFSSKALNIYNSILGNEFSGGILIAKNGEIVFEKYNGFINFKEKEHIKSSTPIHIASISKPITALAILQLVEKKLISLDDTIQKFFPSFPYQNITVLHLLNHRSGLPNYLYFMDTAWRASTKFVTNNDVLQFMIKNQPAAYSNPNTVFHYCNTNYVLLAIIVESVTHQFFPNYIKENIFKPIGMQNSFVININDTSNYVPSYQFNNIPYTLESFDCVYGDKNVYSTVRDLWLLDKALYNNSIISKNTFNIATTAYSNETKGNKNYGLGWRLFLKNNDTVIYHGGWWHGNNSLFTRLIKDTATVITLGNRYNKRIYNSKQMATIFSNKEIGEVEE